MSYLKDVWGENTKGWKGIIIYSILGALIAILIQGLASVAFDTDFPIVTVSSESMVPNLNVGDVVIVKGTNDYNAGDIIIFNGWRDRPIIHRVMLTFDGENLNRYEGFNEFSSSELITKYDGNKVFITKGDNNKNCDQCTGKPIVTEGSIYGEKILKIPYIGLVKIMFIRALNILY